MADTTGQAEIRGIDIDKLAKGFADEEIILKRYCNVTPTSAREIRWYQKTSGFLDSDDTSGVTASQISTDHGALPVKVRQSWTRQTSYIKTFFAESDLMTNQDIKDSDPDIIGVHVRDIVRAVSHQVDQRIYDVLGECTTSGTPNPSTTQNGAATADGWNDTATGDPITDILTAKTALRTYGYDPEGAVLGMNQNEHQYLLQYLINVKGSSIPSFSSQKVQSGVVMEILGCNVVVNTIFTTDYVVLFIPQRSLTFKQFTPLTSAVIDEPLMGKRIRVLEEGECLLTDPKSVYWITDTKV